MFEFPQLHSYPAFYSKQPNLTILSYQLEAWSQLILDYCKHYQVTSLSSSGNPRHSQTQSDLEALPLIFENKTIDRVVSKPFRNEVFRHMIQKKSAEPIVAGKPDQGVYVWWRSVDEWGQLFYDHASSTGQLDTVMTIYELTSPEESSLPDNLKNLDEQFLLVILNDLKKRGKCQVLKEGSTVAGVKFI
ncbi:vacuolar protein-sorting-associated protein 25 [Diutina catenulata]